MADVYVTAFLFSNFLISVLGEFSDNFSKKYAADL